MITIMINMNITSTNGYVARFKLDHLINIFKYIY